MSVDVKTGGPPHWSEGALGPYLRAISAHWVLVILVTALTVAASGAWMVISEPTYEATAELLVTPVPQDDTTFTGVQVLRESSEPTRTMQTAATLVASRQAARRTARELGPGWSVERVEDSVEVMPLGESNVLAVTAQDADADAAARMANLYSRSALTARRRELERQGDEAIRQLRAQGQPSGEIAEVAAERARRLNQLVSVTGGVDPTLSFSQPASVPTSPLGPPSWLVLVLSLLAGLTLGSVTALLIQALRQGYVTHDVLETAQLVERRRRNVD